MSALSLSKHASSSVGASSAAIQHHYDLSNSFYQLWLDQDMNYSCALWEGAQTLEEAQTDKLDYMIGEARAAGASRVLDVGSGWGALLRCLVDKHGVNHAVGITLSKKQVEWLATSPDPRIEVHLESWEDHVPAEPYDAIISIGAFEHFARSGQPEDEKIEGYRRFFAKCHGMLKADGMLALQTISHGATPQSLGIFKEIHFILRRIFPDSQSPTLGEIAQALPGNFEIIRLRNDREHYPRTLRVWLERLQANRSQAVDLVGELAVADYERYLKSSARIFDQDACNLLRLTLRRVDR